MYHGALRLKSIQRKAAWTPPCSLAVLPALIDSLWLPRAGRSKRPLTEASWQCMALLTWISVRAGTRNRSSLLVHLPIDHETKKIWSTFTLLDHHDFWITIDANSMPGILPRPHRPHPTIICVWLHITMTTPYHSLCMTTQTLDVISPAEPMNRYKTLKKKIY